MVSVEAQFLVLNFVKCVEDTAAHTAVNVQYSCM